MTRQQVNEPDATTTGALTFLTGDATNPAGNDTRIIAHVCNNVGGWGRGFVLALTRRWDRPEAAYRAWARDSGRRLPLGKVQMVPVAPQLWVANMVAQHGVARDHRGLPPIRYGALTECLQTLAGHAEAMKASVHMPRIGCGLAGGDWIRVEPLVREHLCDRGVPVTVYDLPNR